jgi:hypothetical protein
LNSCQPRSIVSPLSSSLLNCTRKVSTAVSLRLATLIRTCAQAGEYSMAFEKSTISTVPCGATRGAGAAGSGTNVTVTVGAGDGPGSLGLDVLLGVVLPHDPRGDVHRRSSRCSGSRAPVSLRIRWPRRPGVGALPVLLALPVAPQGRSDGPGRVHEVRPADRLFRGLKGLETPAGQCQVDGGHVQPL